MTHVPITDVIQSISLCSQYTEHSLEWYNPKTEVWVDYTGLIASQIYVRNYNNSIAVFDIYFDTDLGKKWDGVEAMLRIKTTNPYSQESTATIYDQFKVTFQYECRADSLCIAGAGLTTCLAY